MSGVVEQRLNVDSCAGWDHLKKCYSVDIGRNSTAVCICLKLKVHNGNCNFQGTNCLNRVVAGDEVIHITTNVAAIEEDKYGWR